jgi:alcohol dehydrogenase
LKAVTYKAPGQVAVEETAEPRIEQAEDAVVRVTMAAISGTDVRQAAGRFGTAAGQPLGHEFVGVVESVGDGVKRLQPGQRVIAPAVLFCGGCFYCKKGLLSACERRQRFGRGGLGGAQAGLVRVPRADAVLQPIPGSISDTNAVLLSDLLTGPFAGLKLAGLKPGDAVAVVGSGPTGLAVQLLAHTMGAGRVVALDHNGYRRDAAKRLGSTVASNGDARAAIDAVTAGRGADIAIEATGTVEGLAAAAALSRPAGSLLSLGIGIEAGGGFPITSLTDRGVRLIAAGATPVRNYFADVANLIGRGILDPAPLVSHTLSLDEAPRGYEMMARRSDGALKVLLKP